MTATIRAAGTADVDTIAQLIRELAEYERLEAEVSMTPDMLRRNLFGEHRYAEVLLIEEERATAGFAIYFHNFSTFLGRPGIYLEDLYVKPEHRGKGYGKALLRKLAQIAVERGCGRLEWSVLNWNEPAIGFYTSLGARPNDEWTVFRLTGEPLEKLGGSAA